MTGLILVILFVALLAMWFPDVMVPGLLAGIAVTLGLGLVVVMRRLRRIYRQLRALNETVKRNHKRSSVWDWRLNERLTKGGIPELVDPSLENISLLRDSGSVANDGSSRSATGLPAVVDSATRHPWKNHPYASDLLATGVFSVAYYRAASRGKFENSHDAASHYLTYMFRDSLAPSPFIDVSALPPHVRTAMQRGDAATFIDFINSTDTTTSLGPAFDPAYLDSECIIPRGVVPLAYFSATITDETLLPVPPNSPLYGVRAVDYATQVSTLSRQLRGERHLRAPRDRKHWDTNAEEKWKREILHAPVSELPLVSVVLPVWNRVEFVGTAIASIKKQSYTNWELLVVDDHSDDGTWELLQAIARTDARITVLRNTGKGVSSARNTGLGAATGEYIAFLDSDNTWRPDYLDLSIHAAVNGDVAWGYAASRVMNGDHKPVNYRAYIGGLEELLFLNHIDMNVLVVKRELAHQVGGFDNSLRRWVDHDFAIRLAAVTPPAFFPFIGCEYEHDMERSDRITVRESSHWQWVVLAKGMLDWEAESSKERVPGRVSVVIPTYDDATMTVAAVTSVLTYGGLEDVEIVVVDNGCTTRIAHKLIREFAGHPKVIYKRLPKNYNFAIGCNVGFLASTGEHVLFLNNDTEIRTGDLQSLVTHMEDDDVAGVQPLLVYGDDTIQTAGTVWVARDTVPVHFLAGHPMEDAAGIGMERFSAATAAALVVRARDFGELRGFDPFYVNGMEDVDFCLRLLRERPGGFISDPRTVVTHHESKTPGRGKELSANREIFMERWRGNLPAPETALFEHAGFSVAHVGTDRSKSNILGPKPVLVRAKLDAHRPMVSAPELDQASQELDTNPVTNRVPRLRWAIKNPANAGRRGDGWGDTYFGGSLATSLRALGQEVVTYRHEARNSPTVQFDDVSLVLRGLTRIRPIPGQINVMWIISHPEQITQEELLGYDLIYAASASWAERASTKFGVEIRPLLQATDTSRFNLAGSGSGSVYGGVESLRREDARDSIDGTTTARDVIFVGGNHKGRDRDLVHMALEAGVDLTIIGPGWKDLVPDEVLAGEHVPNSELAAVYRSAKFVLADHWNDMATEGFIQNRIFDALACGARVISDPVVGMEEFFGDAVDVCRSLEDIARVVSGDADGVGQEKRVTTAEWIAREHSFDARAEQILRDVTEMLEQRQ